jgi:putative flippase GtrA
MHNLEQRAKTIYFHSFFRYVFVGGTTFLLDIFILFFLHDIVTMSLLVAASFSYWLSIAYNFCLNRSWAFNAKEENDVSRHLALYIVLLGCNYVLSLLIIWLLSQQMHYLVAKVIAVGLQIMWTYPLYKNVIFTRKETSV